MQYVILNIILCACYELNGGKLTFFLISFINRTQSDVPEDVMSDAKRVSRKFKQLALLKWLNIQALPMSICEMPVRTSNRFFTHIVHHSWFNEKYRSPDCRNSSSGNFGLSVHPLSNHPRHACRTSCANPHLSTLRTRD